MSEDFLWWNTFDDFLKAGVASFLAGLFYLMLLGTTGRFVPSHILFAGIFAAIGVTISAVAEEPDWVWALISGLIVGLMIYFQSVAMGGGVSGFMSILTILWNIPVMTAAFVASYFAVELVFGWFSDE